jgi:CheY-like chemotaxis protein
LFCAPISPPAEKSVIAVEEVMTSSNASASKTSAPPLVLVVEDDELIRLNAVDLIECSGFAVIEAKDADEAIEILVRRADVAVVFTDIDMPGSMDGLKLAAAIRNRWPPIEIVITSGKLNPAPHSMPARSRFLAKPYNGERLVETIRALAA